MFKYKISLICLYTTMLIGCSAISPEQLGISKTRWKQYNKQEQEQITNNHKYILQTVKKSTFSAHGDSYLEITLQNGRAIMPPFTDSYAFKPSTLKIREGICQVVSLYAIDANKHTTLHACYNNDVLLLDPSFYEIDKRYGSIRMHYSLLWNDGFSYAGINTSGYTRLQNATIFIKKQKYDP
jgi:hypothetical protein